MRTHDGQLYDELWMNNHVVKLWTDCRRIVDDRPTCGRIVDGLWTDGGRIVDGLWTDRGRIVDGWWTNCGRIVDEN